MKRCVFESLLMLSLAERKARKVQFHRRATVIRGPNDTGKSCLIKTIYRTFSPIPPKLHPNWIAAEVRSAVILGDGRRVEGVSEDLSLGGAALRSAESRRNYPAVPRPTPLV